MDKTKIDSPIDAVITWVNGDDELYQKKMLPYIDNVKIINNKEFKTRFNQVGEIKFTVDSILKFAPFIRNIFIVTDNQTPSFLENKNGNDQYNNVKIVDHKDIFKGFESYLPTFNCRSIETRLYKIPELSEHFIYFNDDIILIKRAKSEDFFVDGLPVIRGKWLKFDEDIFYKKIKIFLFNKKNKRVGHKVAQQRAARNVGFDKYFKFHHTPYPLRKSTFENYFTNNNEVEVENIQHKFRNINQFTPQGLVNHLEIKNKTCHLKSNYHLAYVQSYKKPFLWYKIWFKYVELKNEKKFMCLQSLDLAPKKKLRYILNWLSNIIEN